MKITTKTGDQYESSDPLIFQQGGQVAGNGMVYFSNYRGLDMRPTTQDTQKTKDKKNDDLVDNNLIKSLVGKGITSDVNASIQDLADMQFLYNQLDDVDKTSREGIALLNKMLLLSAKVNALLRNAEVFKNAQVQTVARDALSEIAVTSNGLVLQANNGKIGLISPELFALLSEEEKLKFRPLSNAELINEREYNILLLNDTQSFELLNNSTGFVDIQKQIKEIMLNITSSKEDQSYDAYTDPTGKLKEGLEQLKKVSSEPIENITTKISKEQNSSSAKLALEAMWSSLSENSKIYLKSKAALNGLKKEQLDLVAQSYLIKLISPKIKENIETSVLSDLGSTSKKSGSDSSSNEKGEYKFWDLFANDAINKDMQLLSPEGGAYLFTVPTAQYGPLRTREQNPYEKTILGQISELGTIVNKDSGSFGGEMVLNNTLQQGVAYNGDSVARVTLPYTTKDGRIMPDFSLLKNYELLVKLIKYQESGGKKLSAGQKMQIYKAHNIHNLSVDGEPTNVMDFLAIPVYVGELTYDVLDDISQKYLMEDDSDALQLIMLSTFADSKEKVSTHKKLFSKKDDIYKGIIYFPVDKFAGSIKGLINDGGIPAASYKNRQVVEQSRRGWLNQGASGYFNTNLLNIISNDR